MQHDGTVSLRPESARQLEPNVRAGATQVRGFKAEHGAILASDEAFRGFADALAVP